MLSAERCDREPAASRVDAASAVDDIPAGSMAWLVDLPRDHGWEPPSAGERVEEHMAAI